jgi:replicative DNA helicase
LLGALLWDPERIDDVADWLQPQDFRKWGDRAVYATLVGLRNDGRPIDLLQLPDELAAGQYHDAHVERSDGRGPLSAAALHTYLSTTPATPPQENAPARSEHVQYARLVLDDSIRREVEALGTRIDQHARHLAGQDSASAAETLVGVLADVHARIRQLNGRLDEAHRGGSAIAAALNEQAAPAAAGRGQNPDVQDPAAAAAAPTARDLRRAEYTLIGASLISPDLRELAAGRLRARDFANPEIAATWEAIRSLQQHRQPVDVVLVAAEVERQGEVPGLGRGLEPRQLLWLVQRSEHVASPYKAMETVVRAALTRAVHGGSEQLQALLGDRAQSGAELLTSAQHTVSGVEHTVRRLTGTSPIATALTALTPPKGQIPATRRPGPSAAPAPSPPAAAPAAPTRRRQ